MGMADGFAQASGRPAHVNLHTAPGVGNAMGAIFNAQANKSPLLITAGQQARSLMTLQALLTNRDAARMPHPLVKWSYEPPRAAGRPARARARDPSRRAAAEGPGLRLDPDGRLARGGRRRRRPPPDDAHGRAAARAPTRRSCARSRSGSRRRRTRCSSPAPTSTRAAAGTPRSRWPSGAAAGVGGARHRRRPDRLPRGPPAVPGRPAARRSARSSETLAGHDLMLVVGSSVFAYYPNLPGPLLPEGAALVAITSDPDEAARAPMGDAIVADVELTLEALVAAIERPTASAPRRAAPAPEPPAESDPMSPSAAIAALADVFPDDGIVVLESPASDVRDARRGCGSRGRARTTSAPAAASASALPAVARRAAGPARPPGGVRAGRGLGAVRDPGVLDRGRLRHPRDLPRAAQRGVRDPQVVRRDRAGHRRARARPAGARRRRGGRGLRRPVGARRRPRRR